MTINKDFRQKSDKELIEIVQKLRVKLLEYRFKNASGEFDKPNQIRFARKSLAQALTILHERKVNIHHIQMEKLSEMSKAKSIFSAKQDDANDNNDTKKDKDSNGDSK